MKLIRKTQSQALKGLMVELAITATAFIGGYYFPGILTIYCACIWILAFLLFFALTMKPEDQDLYVGPKWVNPIHWTLYAVKITALGVLGYPATGVALACALVLGYSLNQKKKEYAEKNGIWPVKTENSTCTPPGEP